MKLIFKILKYRKTHTLEKTGQKFNLSGERIRQLELQKYRYRCKKHDRYYYNKCSFCFVEKYKLFIEKMDYEFLLNEIKKEAKNHKRDYISIEKRKYIIRKLYDNYGKTFSEIGRLLNKHYTTIMNLYYKT